DRSGDRVRQGPRPQPRADARGRCAPGPGSARVGRPVAEEVHRHDPGSAGGGTRRRNRGRGRLDGRPGSAPRPRARRQGGRPRRPRGRRDREGRGMTWTEKRRVAIPNGELALVDAGDPEAPPVVLLSGGFTSSYLWRGLIPLLSPWMRVIAPDLLGSGDSDSPAGSALPRPAQAATRRSPPEA